MCREGLLHGLRTAISTARRADGTVRRQGLRVKNDSGILKCAIEVVPLSVQEGRHFLVLFHEAANGKTPPSPSAKPAKTGKRAARQSEDEAHSAGPGQGSQFSVRLPLAAPPQHPPAAPRRDAPQHCYRVLVIDDQHDIVRTMQRLLKTFGHEVYTAHDAEEGLRLAHEKRPHIVFSDIGLPGMDGYCFAKKLREDPAAQSAVLIAISGYGRLEDRQRALEAGFDRHLTKPIPFSDIQDVLEKLE
jgi:CheY-like chemotaxis protein